MDTIRVVVMGDEVVDARDSQGALRLGGLLVVTVCGVRRRTDATAIRLGTDRHATPSDVPVAIPDVAAVLAAPDVTPAGVARGVVEVAVLVVARRRAGGLPAAVVAPRLVRATTGRPGAGGDAVAGVVLVLARPDHGALGQALPVAGLVADHRAGAPHLPRVVVAVDGLYDAPLHVLIHSRTSQSGFFIFQGTGVAVSRPVP